MFDYNYIKCKFNNYKYKLDYYENFKKDLFKKERQENTEVWFIFHRLELFVIDISEEREQFNNLLCQIEQRKEFIEKSWRRYFSYFLIELINLNRILDDFKPIR